MDIQKELQRLNELRDELLRKAQTEDGIKQLEDVQPMIRYGTKAHEELLASGYQMSKEDAETIIKERAEDPNRWPYEELRKAKAFLAALNAKPTVTSTRKPWRVRGQSRAVR